MIPNKLGLKLHKMCNYNKIKNVFKIFYILIILMIVKIIILEKKGFRIYIPHFSIFYLTRI